MIKLYIFFLLSILFISCTNKEEKKLSNPLVLKNGLLYIDTLSTTPFTGRNKSRMLDMKIEYDVVEGKKEGDFIIYYSNENIQMTGKMKDNRNIGEWKYFFLDGSIQTTGFYNNDIPTGHWKWYNPNGKVIEEGEYNDGKREGEWKNYDSLGLLEIVRLYKANKLIDSARVK